MRDNVLCAQKRDCVRGLVNFTFLYTREAALACVRRGIYKKTMRRYKDCGWNSFAKILRVIGGLDLFSGAFDVEARNSRAVRSGD